MRQKPQRRPDARQNGLVLTSRIDKTELRLDKIPMEPEYRPVPQVTPAPTGSMDDLVAEMLANDDEARDWHASDQRLRWRR